LGKAGSYIEYHKFDCGSIAGGFSTLAQFESHRVDINLCVYKFYLKYYG